MNSSTISKPLEVVGRVHIFYTLGLTQNIVWAIIETPPSSMRTKMVILDPESEYISFYAKCCPQVGSFICV